MRRWLLAVVVCAAACGAVITEAAAGNPHVKGLVYVAAFAPEAGEPLSAPGATFAPPPLSSAPPLRPGLQILIEPLPGTLEGGFGDADNLCLTIR